MMEQVSAQELTRRIETDQVTEDVIVETIGLLEKRLTAVDRVGGAARTLFVRMANSWCSVYSLASHEREEIRARCTQDVGAILRIMFEAFLQLSYILNTDEQQEHRASLYLDFQAIERLRSQERVLKHDSQLVGILKSSPRREAGEPALHEDFAAVADRFLKSPKKVGKLIKTSDTRDHWYEGSLREIAKQTGFEAQYDLWIGMFHGCIQSSIAGCTNGCIMGVEIAPFWASQIIAHATRLMLDYVDDRLSKPVQAWVNTMTEHPLGDIPPDVAESIAERRA